jgi:hypothetical protein
MLERTNVSFEKIAPASRHYATMSIDTAFTWADCASAGDAGGWYLVVFRSIHRPTADEARLTAYDDKAFHEATGQPGFVHYFRGSVGERGECVSFCIWASRENARDAARKPAHLTAIMITHEMYESYRIETYFLRKHAGTPTFEFVPASTPTPPS